MKHPSTRAVFDYWNKRRANLPAPERADIDPTEIRHALGDTFMLAVDFVDALRFRLAGTRVCALFAREIKGEAFEALWTEASRTGIDDLMGIVTGETAAAVAGLIGHTDDGARVDLELLLLPLAHAGLARIRALGVLAPLDPPYWLGAKPVTGLELGTVRHVGPEVASPSMTFVTPEPERIRVRHGFVVYSGGRETPSGDQTG